MQSLISVNDVLISVEDRYHAQIIFNNIHYMIIPTAIINQDRNIITLTSSDFIMNSNNIKSGGSGNSNTGTGTGSVVTNQNRKIAPRNSILKSNGMNTTNNTNTNNILYTTTASELVKNASTRALESKAIKLEFENQFDSIMSELVKSCLVDLKEYDYH